MVSISLLESDTIIGMENIAVNNTDEIAVFVSSPADATTETTETDVFESVAAVDEPSPPDIGTTWMDISDAFDNWLTCLIDTDHCICLPGKSLKGDQIKQTIDDMLEYGLIDVCDANELLHVGNLWLRLMNAHTRYNAGCISDKRDTISLLMDFYTVKQIGKELCINICVKL